MKLKLTHIGKPAQFILDGNGTLRVTGVTSRGVFLTGGEAQIVFLSGERYRGPLTLNVAGDLRPLQALAPGGAVQVCGRDLRVPGSGLEIAGEEAVVWEAPLPAVNELPHGAAARLLAVARRSVGASPLLAPALDPALIGLREVAQALDAHSPAAIAAALEPFYGLGPGLTPAGDDLVTGLLLALNRWGRFMRPGLDVAELNARVVPTARRKTTGLSAGLIACAAQGQADERLVHALDGALSGGLAGEVCADLLRRWGSSSGCDALAGMLVGLVAIPQGR